MQTIQFIPCTEGYSGTSLRGSIQASFADLKEMFGEPAYEGIGDKITTEFVIDYQVVMARVTESMATLHYTIGILQETSTMIMR